MSCGAELYFQALHNIWIHLASTPQLAELVRELLNRFEDLCLQPRDIVGLICWCECAGVVDWW